MVLDAMKEACEKTLELVAEKAECVDYEHFYVYGSSGDEERISEYDLHGLCASVNKDSILNIINKIK